jgi:hypothetical protein
MMAHFGRLQLLELAGRRELSGPDVVLLHRMAKSAAKERTGIASYLLLTEAAARETRVIEHTRHLTPYAESFEHFGEVERLVHDLRAAWEAYQSSRDPIYIAKKTAMWSGEVAVAGSLSVIWDCLKLPAPRNSGWAWHR